MGSCYPTGRGSVVLQRVAAVFCCVSITIVGCWVYILVWSEPWESGPKLAFTSLGLVWFPSWNASGIVLFHQSTEGRRLRILWLVSCRACGAAAILANGAGAVWFCWNVYTYGG